MEDNFAEMKILVVLPNYAGDILQSTVALRFLKRNFPVARLAVMVREDKKQLLEDNPYIDEVIFKRNRLADIRQAIRFKPRAVILFRTTFFNALLAKLSRAKWRIGFRQELSEIFLTTAIRENTVASYRYELVRLVQVFLKNLGIQSPVADDDWRIMDFPGWKQPGIKEKVVEKLKPYAIFPGKKLLVLSPFASRKTKRLLPEQYRGLVKWMQSEFAEQYELLIVGGQDEYLISEQMFRNCWGKNLVGRFDWKELGCLLSQASLFISPDTGPAYLAQAVGCPTVIFFTSTLPERYGPYPEKVKIVYQPQLCSPCYRDYCRKNYLCLKNFPLNELQEKIRDSLNEH